MCNNWNTGISFRNFLHCLLIFFIYYNFHPYISTIERLYTPLNLHTEPELCLMFHGFVVFYDKSCFSTLIHNSSTLIHSRLNLVGAPSHCLVVLKPDFLGQNDALKNICHCTIGSTLVFQKWHF